MIKFVYIISKLLDLRAQIKLAYILKQKQTNKQTTKPWKWLYKSFLGPEETSPPVECLPTWAQSPEPSWESEMRYWEMAQWWKALAAYAWCPESRAHIKARCGSAKVCDLFLPSGGRDRLQKLLSWLAGIPCSCQLPCAVLTCHAQAFLLCLP